MEKKNRLKDLLKQLDKLENSLPKEDTFSLTEQIINEKYKDVTSQVKQDASLKFLDKINLKLDKFQRDFDLKPVVKTIEDIKAEIAQMHESVTAEFENTANASELTMSELENLIKNTKDDLQGMTGKELSALLVKITNLEDQLSFQDNTSKTQGQTIKGIMADFEKRLADLSGQFKSMGEMHTTGMAGMGAEMSAHTNAIAELTDGLDKLRKDMISRMANIGGGSMNRNIAIGGNTSVLSRYTDINIKAGNNVVLSYTNNNTTKYLDLTITASGSGSGITREINTITVSSTIGAAPSIDYVTLANGGVMVTLPTAVGNTNLYTVKNVGNSSVLVATTGGQTIDGDSTIIMPVQYTSVDLISDNTNWKIT